MLLAGSRCLRMQDRGLRRNAVEQHGLRRTVQSCSLLSNWCILLITTGMRGGNAKKNAEI